MLIIIVTMDITLFVSLHNIHIRAYLHARKIVKMLHKNMTPGWNGGLAHYIH